MSTPPVGSGAGPRAAPSRGGFTLVELVLATTLTVVLGATIVGLLLHQNQFFAETDERVFAAQTRRAAADLLTRELRMASVGDLVLARPDSLAVRSDRYRGVVCRVVGDQVTFYVYDEIRADLSTGVGSAVLPAGAGAYVYAPGWDAYGAPARASDRAACQSNGAPSAGVSAGDYRTVDFSTAGALATPAVGAAVRVYGRLVYHFAPGTFDPGLALWRNGQELGGPFEAGAGFRYLLDDGSVASRVPAAGLDRVRRIRIEATATGGSDPRSDVGRKLLYEMTLRGGGAS